MFNSGYLLLSLTVSKAWSHYLISKGVISRPEKELRQEDGGVRFEVEVIGNSSGNGPLLYQQKASRNLTARGLRKMKNGRVAATERGETGVAPGCANNHPRATWGRGKTRRVEMVNIVG
jgi:hypothetical protein